MSRRLEIIVLALVALGAAAAGAGITFLVANKTRVEVAVGETRGDLLSLRAPPGTVTIETNPDYKGSAAPAPAAAPSPAATDWPSYNKTLSSERFSDLSQINTKNVGKLKVLCAYETGLITSFETGPIMVEGGLIGTTEFDIFSIDPATCAQNWRVHEEYPAYILPTNRGAAYLDGMLFRGTEDGRVLAYDFKTGKRLWETTIADVKKGEAVPGAPIAWQGLVYVGNAGGDFKGGKGAHVTRSTRTRPARSCGNSSSCPSPRTMLFAGPRALPRSTPTRRGKTCSGAPVSGGGAWTSATLDPATGLLYVPVGNPAPDYDIGAREGENLFTDSVVVLDAKTGAYKNHYKIVPRDWHDWDVSNPPILFQTAGVQEIDGGCRRRTSFLYGFDRADNKLLCPDAE